MPTENRSSNTEMVSVPREHELNIRQTPLADLLSGLKTGEVRDCSDREFAVGDTVLLREIDDAHEYTGTVLRRTITHVQKHYGLPDHLCVLSYGQPAPQPHPEPIAWMVGTAFWWTKEEEERDSVATGLPVVGLGPLTGAEPAEQRQVDQVVNAEQVLGAYQFASFGPANHLHGTTNWCAAFAQELNHRIGADTAEVERIGKELREVREERDDLCRRVDDFQSRTHGIRNLSAIEQLTDKLAERDALLTKMKALFRADDPFDLYDAVCSVLPASAEPRATTPQTINGHKLNCKAVDDYKPGQCSCGVEIDHEIPGTSFQRLNALANQGE